MPARPVRIPAAEADHPGRLVCFACGRAIRGYAYWADTRDDQEVFVGRDCHQKIREAGEAGYQPPKGGPRLYPPPEGCLTFP